MKFTNITPVLIALSLLCCSRKQAEKVVINNRIIDQSDVLTSIQEDSLLIMINHLDKRVGSQLAVVVMDSLNGELIEGVALQKMAILHLGREKYDDGVLLAVALGDRRARIEVGEGLKMIITEEVAARIIREEMSPPFNEKNYFKGIKAAVMTIKELIEENKSLIMEKK
jgi:uncharacterized protein